MWVVVEVIFLCLVIYVGIVDDVVFFHELLGVMDDYWSLTSDGSLFYIDWNLEIEVSLLDVFIQEKQPTWVDLEIGIGHFKLFISKKSELILNKLNPFLDSLKVLRKCLSFLTFF